MVITQLNIEAFGSLKDRVIDLRSGMNIIAVNNEEIRETIAAFVLAMLYGMDREQPEFARYFPGFASAAYGGKLRVLQDGTFYEMTRHFPAEDAEVSVVHVSDGTEVTDAAGWLRRARGNVSAETYRAAGYISAESLEADAARYTAAGADPEEAGKAALRRSREAALTRAKLRRERLRAQVAGTEDPESFRTAISDAKKNAAWLKEEITRKRAGLSGILPASYGRTPARDVRAEHAVGTRLKAEMLEAKRGLEAVSARVGKKNARTNIPGTILGAAGLLLGLAVYFFYASRRVVPDHPDRGLVVWGAVIAAVLFVIGLLLSALYAARKKTPEDEKALEDAREAVWTSERVYQTFLEDPAAFLKGPDTPSGENPLEKQVREDEAALLALQRRIADLERAERTETLKRQTQQRLAEEIRQADEEVGMLEAQLAEEEPEEDEALSRRAERYLAKAEGGGHYRLSLGGERMTRVDAEMKPVRLTEVPGRTAVFALIARRMALLDSADPGNTLPLVLPDILPGLSGPVRASAAAMFRACGRQVAALSGEMPAVKDGETT